MSIVLHIPVWLCWLVGIPVGLFLLFALMIGVAVIISPPRIF